MFRREKQTVSHKGRKLTKKEITSHIEQLRQGEALNYSLPDAYGSQLAVVEFNTMYPWRGSKYTLSTQTLVDGKPSGEKVLIFESDEVKDIAAWISRRKGSSGDGIVYRANLSLATLYRYND